MKIDFLALFEATETIGWTKTVALVRNGFEADIISELECRLVLEKMQKMFEHYHAYSIQDSNSWYAKFNSFAFDLNQRFDLERELENESHMVAAYNKREQELESWNVPTAEQYPILTGEL